MSAAESAPRVGRPWSTLCNFVLIGWTLFGPLGLSWLSEHRQHIDQCAAMGVIPLQGPAGLLSLLVLPLVVWAKRHSRGAFLWALGSWLLLFACQVLYWMLFAALPPATKC